MGQRSSNPLVCAVVSTTPVTDDMRLVVGYLEKDEFVTAAPNWSKLGDVLDELQTKYGGLFLLHRDCLFCEWRSKETLWGNPGKRILLLPGRNDVVERIYESKSRTEPSAPLAYKEAVRNFGYQVGMPIIELDT